MWYKRYKFDKYIYRIKYWNTGKYYIYIFQDRVVPRNTWVYIAWWLRSNLPLGGGSFIYIGAKTLPQNTAQNESPAHRPHPNGQTNEGVTLEKRLVLLSIKVKGYNTNNILTFHINLSVHMFIQFFYLKTVGWKKNPTQIV